MRVLIVAAALALLAWRFVVIDAASDSASDTLRPWAIEAVIVAVLAILLLRAGASRARPGD